MGRLFRCIAFALALANTPAIAPGHAAEPVDLLLVLAADVSRSVDSRKFELQREGYEWQWANPEGAEYDPAVVMAASAFCLEWSGLAVRSRH